MDTLQFLTVIAADSEYGCGSYGVDNYQTCSSTQQPPTTTPTPTPSPTPSQTPTQGQTQSTSNKPNDPISGLLANTGDDILLPLLFGLSLIIASLWLIARRLVNARKQRSVQK